MLVLFDVDDTLLDDATATRDAVDALREYLQLSVPEQEFRTRWFSSLRHHFERYVVGQVDFQSNVVHGSVMRWLQICRTRMLTRFLTSTFARACELGRAHAPSVVHVGDRRISTLSEPLVLASARCGSTVAAPSPLNS
jgi:phosphoglycolate phosphatase-like HAD superfamily hydrolase